MSFLKAVLPIKADIELEVDEKAWLGQKMKGVATLNAKEVFTVDEMRLELRVFEHYSVRVSHRDSKGHTTWSNEHKTDAIFSRNQTISDVFTTTIGLKREFPFETAFPDEKSHHRGSLTYSLKAVANVKGRADVTRELSRPKDQLYLTCVPGTDFKDSASLDATIMGGKRRCLECQRVYGGSISTPCPFCGSSHSSPVVDRV